MKTQSSIEDEFMPIQEAEFAGLSQIIQKRTRLKRAKEEFECDQLNTNTADFGKYIEKTYGLRLIRSFNGGGLYQTDITVVNEKKYLLFLLKFGL